jgi:hypothetical protein
VRGDPDDIKKDLALILQGPSFRTTLGGLVGDKQDGFLPLLPGAVYQEERLSHLVFPMCELIAYKTDYQRPDDIVKYADVHIGARWTAVAKDEKTVTRYVELLVRATVDILWGISLPRVNSGPILVTEEDYSPMVPTVEHPYVKSGTVMLTVPIWRS